MSASSSPPGSASAPPPPEPTGLLLREMILGALVAKGGQAYLEERAEANPVAFLSLVAKVLPSVLKGPGEDGVPKVVVRRLGTAPPDGEDDEDVDPVVGP